MKPQTPSQGADEAFRTLRGAEPAALYTLGSAEDLHSAGVLAIT